jgi:hypothetical protein
MKKSVIVAVLAIAACVSYADLNVGFRASEGFYEHTGATSIVPAGSGDSLLVQLLASPDTTQDQAYAGETHYLDPTGNDVWLMDYVWTEGTGEGSEWANFPSQQYLGGTYNDGWYIYARIFESDSPVAGTWYFAGPADLQQDTTVPPGTPQDYNMNSGPGFGDTPDQQVAVIPEPSTIMLALVGCLPIVARIIRRRK